MEHRDRQWDEGLRGWRSRESLQWGQLFDISIYCSV
jgi:hypothetical protein